MRGVSREGVGERIEGGGRRRRGRRQDALKKFSMSVTSASLVKFSVAEDTKEGSKWELPW